MANGLTQKGKWYYATTRYKDVNGKWKTKYIPTKVPADGSHNCIRFLYIDNQISNVRNSNIFLTNTKNNEK